MRAWQDTTSAWSGEKVTVQSAVSPGSSWPAEGERTKCGAEGPLSPQLKFTPTSPQLGSGSRPCWVSFPATGASKETQGGACGRADWATRLTSRRGRGEQGARAHL